MNPKKFKRVWWGYIKAGDRVVFDENGEAYTFVGKDPQDSAHIILADSQGNKGSFHNCFCSPYLREAML